jgi:hypothetical protein
MQWTIVQDRQRYAQICGTFAHIIPVFLQDWWLDTTAQTWYPQVIYDAEQAVGIWPVAEKRKFGLTYQTLPTYTPYGGPWWFPGTLQPPASALNDLLKAIPKATYQLEHPFYAGFSAENWQENGFQTKYFCTYRIAPDLPEVVYERFSSMTKNLIERAQKKVRISEDTSFEQFTPVLKYFLQKKGLLQENSIETITQILQNAQSRNQGQLLCAYQNDSTLLAGLILVHDARTTYALIIVSNPEFPKSNAIRVLLWHAIKEAMLQGRTFDFEGGNMPGIGDFYASFGAEKVPYLRVVRYRNKSMYSMIRFAKRLMGAEPTFQ